MKNVAIEVGRFVQGDDRAVIVDDIQLIKLVATPYPTFSPTRNTGDVSTSQPAIRTDAPTSANLFSCPLVGNAPFIVSSGSVLLQVVEEETLCTLTKSRTPVETGETTLIPIARSYDNNTWEKSAGEFAASIFGGKEIPCYPSGCQVELPALEEGAQYLLSSYSHSLSETEEYARFLETATFGTTQNQLDLFGESNESAKNTIARWLADQMDSNITQITSHREYWRRGLNIRVC